MVNSMKDFYWDIRPKPEYGTIELRVCDTPLTVERAAALACYLQALCRYLLERAASRRRSRTTTSSTTTTASRPAASGSTARWCTRRATSSVRCARTSSPPSSSCGTTARPWSACPRWISVHALAREGSDASWLRREHAERGSVEGMVEAALTRFRA